MRLMDIGSMYLSELIEDFCKLGIEKYRAKQVYGWIAKGVTSFDDMDNIPVNLRQYLKQNYQVLGLKIRKKLLSTRDEVVKYAFEMYDGDVVESVLLKYKHGYCLCVSSQVGCKMRCSFCATGIGGFSRNLFASEMLSQIQVVQKDTGIRISNVVIMGMGEPLDNYDNVVRFLRLVSDENGLCIGMRHISLSTCGLVDKIYKLAEEKLQITLSVSLHAPDDDLRTKLMPINSRWNIKQLLDACKYYIQETGRRISFEYAMIGGVNDSTEHAEKLSHLLKGMLCHVNLIPMNAPVESDGNSIFRKSGMKKIMLFCSILSKNGINVTVRRTLGADISASCGQLRQREIT